MSGKFFPIQLIYKGITSKCLPKNVNFPKDWDITCTENHWSNKSTSIDYIIKIVIPYVNGRRKELKLSADHPALAIFNVFKGQCTERVFRMLEDNNILYVIVPSNCTDILQPLDLSVNKSAKDFMRSKFQEWYGGIIYKQLEDQIEEEVDMRLSVMKPLTAGWIIDFITTWRLIPRFLSMVFMQLVSRTCMLPVCSCYMMLYIFMVTLASLYYTI